jgi:16S rRNA (uracil1498-N3)-methyltransferase
MRRFVVGPEAIESGRVRFDAAEARHLARVLRLHPGAVVEAADGGGRLYAVRLDVVGPREAWGTIVGDAGAGPASRESPCAITLAQAILKGDRMAWLIQKVTELGVTRIVPLETTRVVARPEAGRAPGRQRRWQRVAREAVKQCGRTVVPVVESPRPLGAALAEAGAHEAAWLLWEGGGIPLATLATRAGRPRRLLLVVGPEGGFTEAERAAADSAGLALVGLGPRTLRAESAGVTAVALCQHLFGDLGTAPG